MLKAIFVMRRLLLVGVSTVTPSRWFKDVGLLTRADSYNTTNTAADAIGIRDIAT